MDFQSSIISAFTSLVSNASEICKANPFWACLIVLGAAGLVAVYSKSLGK